MCARVHVCGTMCLCACACACARVCTGAPVLCPCVRTAIHSIVGRDCASSNPEKMHSKQLTAPFDSSRVFHLGGGGAILRTRISWIGVCTISANNSIPMPYACVPFVGCHTIQSDQQTGFGNINFGQQSRTPVCRCGVQNWASLTEESFEEKEVFRISMYFRFPIKLSFTQGWRLRLRPRLSLRLRLRLRI